MALLFGSAKKIVETFRNKFADSLLCLGKQSVILFEEDIKKLDLSKYHKKNFDYLKNDLNKYLPKNSFKKKYINKLFFLILGFSEIKSLDVSKYQNAEIIFDLNKDNTPKKIRNRFDCILDGSTSEHIFSTLNVLKNIHRFLKKGGYVIHVTSLNNMSKDGFYQFHPNYFKDFYSVNGYKIIKNLYWVMDYEKKIFNQKTKIKIGRDYFYKNFKKADHFSRKKNLPLQIIFIARKISNKKIIVPQQKFYLNKKDWLKNTKI